MKGLTTCRACRSALRAGPSQTICRNSFLASVRSQSTLQRPGSTSHVRRWPYPLGLSLALLPGLFFYFSSESTPLSPHRYTEQPISSNVKISPQHALVSIPVPPEAASNFTTDAVRRDGTPSEENEVVVQHVMMRNPDIQIERPYTPVGDTAADGEMRLVVKRVRGGEVGRLVHSIKAGGAVGIRGPITTFSIRPDDYDRIVMVSTGTGVAPFLQLLNKVPVKEAGPTYHLLHLQPRPGKEDWVEEAGLLEGVQKRLGKRLHVDRPPASYLKKETMKAAVLNGGDNLKTIILVCLPAPLLSPLCGGMTPNLEQGPLTGVLAELGVRAEQVWKLE